MDSSEESNIIIQPSKYISTVSFPLLFAGLFCFFIYLCSSIGDTAYYALIAGDSAILLGTCILMINIFILAMNSNSYFVITITTIIMIAFLGSLAIELYLLLKYKMYITEGQILETFWKFGSISLYLTTIIIVIFTYVFLQANAQLSLLSLAGLSIFSVLKVIVTNLLNEMLVYFRTDGFQMYLLQ
jgi:hypothetical protein